MPRALACREKPTTVLTNRSAGSPSKRGPLMCGNQWPSKAISSNDVQECRLPLDTIKGPPIRIGGERDCEAQTVTGDRPAKVAKGAARGHLV